MTKYKTLKADPVLNTHRFFVDKIEDLNSLPMEPASTALVANKNQMYVCNNKKQWVPFNLINLNKQEKEITGSLSINSNDTYDVTDYATVVVNVPNPSAGTFDITENGTYDVTNYANVDVDFRLTPTYSISITLPAAETETNRKFVINYMESDLTFKTEIIDETTTQTVFTKDLPFGSFITIHMKDNSELPNLIYSALHLSSTTNNNYCKVFKITKVSS